MTDDDDPAMPPARPRSFREVLATSDEDHDNASVLALVGLGAATGCSPRAAQRLLDGPVGAGLGAMVVQLCDEAGLAPGDAVVEAIRRQQDWGFGHADALHFGLSHRTPYLSGWLSLLEAEEGAPFDRRDAEVAEVPEPMPASDHPRHPAWRRVMGEGAPELPQGVEEAFRRIEHFGFVVPLWPTVGEVELVTLGLAASLAVATEADVSGEAALAFLRDLITGQAFGEAIRIHLLLDPEGHIGVALQGAIDDWKARPLPPAAAAHFGAEPGMSRLRALALWHEREGGAGEGA